MSRGMIQLTPLHTPVFKDLRLRRNNHKQHSCKDYSRVLVIQALWASGVAVCNMESSTSPPNASALLQAYLAAPLPYLVDDWVKSPCPTDGCTAEKRFYCANCVCWIGVPSHVDAPRLRLPVNVDIVLADNRKKSTAIQVGVVASSSIRVWDSWTGGLEALERENWDVEKTLVLFPSKDAITLDELPVADLASIERVVVLDSRWNNTTKVLEHPGITRLTKRVKLKDPPKESLCWRYHSKGEGLLSSAEALYFLLKDYVGLTGKGAKRLNDKADGSGREEEREDKEETAPLEEMMYLFRLNVNVIKGSYERGARRKLPLPMEAAGKQRCREVRCQLKGVAYSKKYRRGEREGGGTG
ncbi:hypothetical protein VYU27_000372 [Nannochloropsis oceanica]